MPAAQYTDLVRFAVFALLCAAACGKELNADFCDAHPSDDRCLMGTGADATGRDGGGSGSGDAGPLPTCPSNYDITIASQPRSKYSIEDGIDDWNSAVVKCAAEMPGATHLVVIGSQQELTELDTWFDRKRFVGVSDKNTSNTYLAVTDEVVSFPALYMPAQPTWATGEPNSSGNCVAIDVNLQASDEDCTGATVDLAWMCECDDYADQPNNY